MDMSSLCDPHLSDGEDVKGWDKQTVRYCTNNERKVKAIIKSCLNKIIPSLRVQSYFIEDIYSEVVQFFYNVSDYDLEKASNGANPDRIVSFEEYLSSSVKNCVKRAVTNEFKRTGNLVTDIYIDENKEASVLDILPDEKDESRFDAVVNDIDSMLESLECYRYRFGVDIYQFWYIMLLMGLEEKSSKKKEYEVVFEALGVGSAGLKQMISSSEMPIMSDMAEVVMRTGEKEVIESLERYVYGAASIKRVVQSLSKAS